MNFEDITQVLRNHPQTQSVHRDADGLIVVMDERAYVVMSDADFGRTLIWTWVRRLAASELTAGAVASINFNRDCFAPDGLAMGLLAAPDGLVIGRSLDGPDPAPALLLEALLELHGAQDDALDRFYKACGAPASSIGSSDLVDVIRA